MKTAKQQ